MIIVLFIQLHGKIEIHGHAKNSFEVFIGVTTCLDSNVSLTGDAGYQSESY